MLATQDRRAPRSAEGMERVRPAPCCLWNTVGGDQRPGFEIKIHKAGSLLLNHLGSSSEVVVVMKRRKGLPGSQVFKTLPSSAEGVGLIWSGS